MGLTLGPGGQGDLGKRGESLESHNFEAAV